MKFTSNDLAKLKPQSDKPKRAVQGYYWHNQTQKWKVNFRIDGVSWYGGVFENEQDAIDCVLNKKAQCKLVTRSNRPSYATAC